MARQTVGPELMTTADAAEYLNMPVSTLNYWRTQPDMGPSFLRPSPRRVLYKRADLDAFIDRAAARGRGDARES